MSSIYRTNSSFMAFPQNNIINHSANVAKYINELVMQYSNDENIIVFNGCPSQSMPPIGLLMFGHWVCLEKKYQYNPGIMMTISLI